MMQRARIDVVVGTHRHSDHVSGFEQKIWSKVQVSEVWLPWTENPNGARARRFLESQSKRSLALVRAIAARIAPVRLASKRRHYGALAPRCGTGRWGTRGV